MRSGGAVGAALILAWTLLCGCSGAASASSGTTPTLTQMAAAAFSSSTSLNASAEFPSTMLVDSVRVYTNQAA